MDTRQTSLISTMLANHVFFSVQLILIVTLLLPVFPVHAEDKKGKTEEETRIYKSKNVFGHTVYSDQASDDSEEIELEVPTEYDGLQVIQELSRASRANRNQQQPVEPQKLPPYDRVSIVSPTNGEIVRDNAGNITIRADVSPAIQPGHVLQLMLDGALVASGANSASIQNLDRGTHNAQIRVVQANNQKVFQEGSPASFTILRHSVLNRSPQN